MQILWEKCDWPSCHVDQPITWLSWFGLSEKPDEGYLAAGSQPGIVGITLTSISPSRDEQHPAKSGHHHSIRRLNYNLRGHRSAVRIVEWNRAQKKLASCDETGMVYVWICYDDRWSVELVNDRTIPIRDFEWSPSGEFALICYSDNFVLVGSSQGQRVWSLSMNTDNGIVHVGTWLPGEQGVVLGTDSGELVLMNADGAEVGRFTLWERHSIELIAWSPARKCEPDEERASTLAVCFQEGKVYFLRNCDDPDPVIQDTCMDVKRMQWSLNGEFLATVGTDAEKQSYLKIYDAHGTQLLTEMMSCDKSITGVTWGCNDPRIFVALENRLHVGHV